MRKNIEEAAHRTRMEWAYADAIGVQNASNISGVLFSFARHMQTLCDEGLDSRGKANHPVTILFLDKLVSLTDKGWVEWADGAYNDANQACLNAVEGALVLE